MNYDQIVSNGGPAAVLFTSATCGPCKRLKPRMAAMAEARGFELHVLDIAQEMPAVRALGIRGVPAMVALGPVGEPRLLFQGDRPDADIERLLTENGVIA